MKIFYSDLYTLPLPEHHRFPIEKYRMLRDYLVEHQIIDPQQLHESPQATPEELSLAHVPAYVESVRDGSVDIQIIKRIGFPWSYNLYLRSCATVGGALAAAKSALVDGIAGNLAGGTHHAHADRGEGYCVFNDIAVATRYLKKEKLSQRVAIIDLDVHQGNGNSSILGHDEGVFIFSIHGEKNYPFIKVPSHLDIALPTGATDDMYLEALAQGLEDVKKFKPDYIFYQTGVDPLEFDHLGKMSISFEGLKLRDEMVISYALKENIPISLALGGGYAKPIEKSVEAYANTYRVVRKLRESHRR
ncbi:MAG: histone deacetylase [Bdellovibrionales bacterium]|nr:histone deacetylase [Bdellovibrionales bacterium]